MAKKRILFVISGLHFEKSEGAKNRLDLFINSYSSKGYDVSVILFYSLSSIKYWFSRSKFLNHRANWYTFPTLPISKNIYLTRISRGLNQILFFFISRWINPQIVQLEASGTEAKWAPNDAFVVTDFHGDAVSEEVFRNNGHENWLSKRFIFEQKRALTYSDLVITVSENLKSILETNTGKRIENYGVMPCAVNLKKFNDFEVIEMGISSDRTKIGYIGGLQKWQNLGKMLDIVLKLREKDEKYFFILFTNDDPKPYSQKLSLIGKENYLIKGLKSNEVPSFLSQLDIGLILRDDDILNIVSSPTKTAEYLAAGVPVLCTKYSGDYGLYIEHRKQGFVLENTTLKKSEINSLLEYLNHVKKNRLYYSEICKTSVEMNSWESSFDRIFSNHIPQ